MKNVQVVITKRKKGIYLKDLLKALSNVDNNAIITIDEVDNCLVIHCETKPNKFEPISQVLFD